MPKNSFKIAARDSGSKASQLIDKVIAERPDLAGETFYVPERGNIAVTVMTDAEVFKSPKVETDGALFQQELSIMEKLSRVNLEKAPKLTFVASDKSWFGMERRAGEILSLDKVTEKADLLGAFKAELENATRISVMTLSDKEKKIFKDIRDLARDKEVHHLLRTEPAVIKAFCSYADNLPYRDSYINHGDWNVGNLLFSAEDNGLSAVIDYGCAGYTIFPEKELVLMSEYFPEPYYNGFATAYLASQNDVSTKDIACYAIASMLHSRIGQLRQPEYTSFAPIFAQAAARFLVSPIPSLNDKDCIKMRFGA